MFTVGQTYKTRDGRDARVIATDLKGEDTIAAVIEGTLYTYQSSGRYYLCEESDIDLMPQLPPCLRPNGLCDREQFVSLGHGYSNLESAVREANGWPVVKLTVKDGVVVSSELADLGHQ